MLNSGFKIFSAPWIAPVKFEPKPRAGFTAMVKLDSPASATKKHVSPEFDSLDTCTSQKG